MRPLPRQRLTLLVLVLLSLGLTNWTSAATLPAGFSETQVASGLQSVTAMTIAPDGRVFVCEQVGRLRVLRNDTLLATPFLTVSVNSSGERGLLGVAFDPNFATNRFVYIYYTTSSSPIHNRISRFTASATNPDVAQAGSEVQIFNLPNLSSATNHNGGALHFGPDGKLYVVVGENATPSNSQSLNTTLGKVLRLNPDGTIPTDNPFFNQTTGNNRAIWARGLRNPFTFNFQPGTGRMHVNDVGQNSWEEVNRGIAGANYGWPQTEGNTPPGQAGVTYPLHTYSSSTGSACAVVGAAFYNPAVNTFGSAFTGRYFFGDFCGGFIRTLAPPNYTTSSGFATNVPFLVDLAVSNDGFLYYLARGQQGTGSNGQVFKVRGPNVCTVPSITDQPDPLTRAPGQSATFSVVASGTQPLSYQWQRAAPGSGTFTNIAGATNPSLTVTATTADNGARYRVVVSNTCPGTVTSAAATLTVTAAVTTATITTPGTGTTYQGGVTINFAGTGADPAGNPLPASAFTWQVDFHHAAHTHPHVPATSGITSGSFVTADRGHTETDVFYRITLTVTSGTQTATDTVDVLPQIVTLQLVTNPAGLAATLDGQPVTAPQTFQSVAGVFRTIGTSTPQTLGGATFDFDRWSDAGDLTHELRTPAANTTFTAFFTSDSTCVTRNAGNPWLNTAFSATQTGTFTARFDATPSINNIPGSGHIAFSNGAQTAFSGFANIIRFSSSGNIDARNGGAYAASNTIPYTAGVTYHFRVAVNIPAHTYSIFVTPDGGTEQTVGSNFAFRTEQAGVTSLNNVGVFTGAGSGGVTVCNFAIDPPPTGGCLTTNQTQGFQNTAMAAQAGTFTVEYDATPSIANINSTISLSNGAVSANTSNAVIVRFNPSGTIDVRNGGAYTASTNVPFTAGQTYHVRLVVNVTARTYSAFVTPPGGGGELTLGTNVAFRTEQAGVTQLNNWDRWVGTAPGAIQVCNFTVSGGGPPPVGDTPVALNGQLHVCGTQLCNERNNPIQLRGMSTHGLQWFGRGAGSDNCVADAALDALATDWQADVLRISLYVQEGGYETDPTRFTNEVHTMINEVTERGMYALVDWHMLDPGNPNDNLARARTFFTAIATQHNAKNNIIYEVANEPNGVSWATIKSYAEQIIPTIRAIDPDAVIIVGSRAWSSLGVSDGATADEIFNNPVNATNIMYTFHFYAASHGAEYRNELSRAADRIPMFVTEFGTQEFTGDGGNDFTAAQQYIDLMRTKKISWVNWNFSHDFRTGAVFTTGTCPGGPFAGTSRLKAAGSWIRDRIRTPADEFPN